MKIDNVTLKCSKYLHCLWDKYFSYKISNYLTLENCLFSGVTKAKNADINKYKYSGYGIGFDRHESFSLPGIGWRRNVIMFGVDMSS